MYYVSTLINDYLPGSNAMIYIDGQNSARIQQYKRQGTNGWNPCIPVPFNSDISVTITFTTSNWRDWYPVNDCDFAGNNDRYYQNSYLFDGGYSLTFNSMAIITYSISSSTNYPIIRTVDHYNASISINEGRFISIDSSTGAELFLSSSSFYIRNSSFINMQVGVIFHEFHDGEEDSKYRFFVLEHSSLQSISAQTIFRSTAGAV